MSDVIESDKKITHEKLAEQIEGKLDDGAYWLKFKPSDGVSIPFLTRFRTLCLMTIFYSLSWNGDMPNGVIVLSFSQTAIMISNLQPNPMISA